MKDIELPPLPHWCEAGSPFAEQMQAYARAAVEADRAQRVPHQVYLSGRTLIDAARRDWPSTATHRARVLEAASALESALLASTPAPAQQEPSEAEMVCAEAYQVVGCLLSDLGLFETEAARKILDNLSEARRVHQDVLPWRSDESHCISEKPQEKRPDRWCSKNECRMIGGCSRKPIQVGQHQEPPQQERKPMTPEQVAETVFEVNGNEPSGLFWRDLVSAVERHHGIRKD